MPPITKFRGQYGFLSNFYEAPITYDGRVWPTTEHAFAAFKTVHHNEQEYIREQPSPGAAKRAGRSVELRPDWEQVKVSVMYAVCYAKFQQHPDLGKRLLATGDAVLIEGNTWGDREWGCVDGRGRNLLGQTLMNVRTALRVEAQIWRQVLQAEAAGEGSVPSPLAIHYPDRESSP